MPQAYDSSQDSGAAGAALHYVQMQDPQLHGTNRGVRMETGQTDPVERRGRGQSC